MLPSIEKHGRLYLGNVSDPKTTSESIRKRLTEYLKAVKYGKFIFQQSTSPVAKKGCCYCFVFRIYYDFFALFKIWYKIGLHTFVEYPELYRQIN